MYVGATKLGNEVVERRQLDLIVKVTKTFFDVTVSSLHVSGTITEANETAGIGQHHTLDLELNRPCVIWKADGWDSVARRALREAVSDDKGDAVAAVAMHEGLANICLITGARTVLKQRVEHAVPRKQASQKERGQGSTAFYEKTLATLLRAADFSQPRTLLLASPGFWAQDFRNYIKEQGIRGGNKVLDRLARDSVVVHSSTGFVHSLNEVLQSPQVQATMRDQRSAAETGLMDRLWGLVRQDDGRAWYGVGPVERAVQGGAVGRGGGVLLANNKFFRSMDVAERARYVALVDKVSSEGGEVKILSSDHESGQRLDALGGIAAILTFPLYELDEEQGGEGDDDEKEVVADGEERI